MAGTLDVGLFKEGMIVLATAAVLVPAARHLRISPVITFLAAGALLGPHGLASLSCIVPPLEWITISRGDGLGVIGELGVVALLFLIGLELSYPRLMTMRRLVFGLGSLQILLAAAAIGGLLALVGAEPGVAVAVGFSLALSSTAIVIETLSQQGRLATSTGRTSFSILLMQDLAVVPLIFLVTIMSGDGETAIGQAVLQAFLQAGLAIAIVASVAWLVLRPFFRFVAATHSADLFVAATLLVIVGSGLVTASAGMSMALGAFVAGLLLAETEYRRAIQATVEPFKGLLLGVFFFSVGMSLDLAVVANNPAWVLGGTLTLLAVKIAMLLPLLWAFGVSRPTAVETALLLAPGGEFAFITITLGVLGGLIHKEIASVMLAITTLSMLLIPLMDILGRRLAAHLEEAQDAEPATLVQPSAHDDAPRAIVIGYGRVGRLVCEMLEGHGLSYVGVDRNPTNVAHAHRDGRPIYYGNARSEAFLYQCGLQDTEAVLITLNQPQEAEELVRQIRGLRPDVMIIARARDAEHARKLYDLGATDAVPETIEASLQLAEASLVGLGVATGRVIASIHEKRDEFRIALQGAGGYAGQAGEGSMRHPAAGASVTKPARANSPGETSPSS